MRGHRLWAALIAVLAMMLVVGACTPQAKQEPPESKAGFDPRSVSWSPKDVAAAGPCLVGWRYANDAHGALVMLDRDGGSDVLWEAPVGTPLVQLVDIAPDGMQMVASVEGDPGGSADVRYVVFRADGGADNLPLPEGFEGIQDIGFMGEDLLLLASHATADTYSTKMGVVGTDGKWRDLTITGQVPEHWFIESFVTLPGSDLVGLVLKTGSGTTDRDDDALVLAKRTGTELQVFTPAYPDDFLPGCEPLWDAQGVAFARTPTEPANDAAVYVRVEWTGSEWVEGVIAPTTIESVVEKGDVIAEDPAGDFWLRSAASGGHEAASTLLRVPKGAATPAETGIDATGIDWFRWIDASQ